MASECLKNICVMNITSESVKIYLCSEKWAQKAIKKCNEPASDGIKNICVTKMASGNVEVQDVVLMVSKSMEKTCVVKIAFGHLF